MTPMHLAAQRYLALLMLSIGCLLPQGARAELTVFPTRLVFDKNARAAQVEVINNGGETLTYRVAISNRKMSEDGVLSEAASNQPEERFADTMLRFSPRKITLEPGASQTVRIQLRKPAELAPGEYRSHLMFSQVPQSRPPQSPSDAADTGGQTQVEIKLIPLLGVSIPIIVRQGLTSATATLANARIEGPPGTTDATPFLALDVLRQGNRSLFGDLIVTLSAPGGTAQQLARVNGLAVYVPNARRQLRIALPSMAFTAGSTLTAVFAERPEGGGNALAQMQVTLP